MVSLSQTPKFSANRASGFTLLEVLIAIGITAMIGLGSWQILNSAIRTSESTQLRLQEVNALQKTMLVVSRDLKQVAPRSVRDEYGDYTYALDNKGDDYLLELTRVGWRNPLNDKRSDVQRVAYAVEDGKFVRYHWLILDRAQDSEPLRRTLLQGVDDVQFRFMKESKDWSNNWPTEASTDSSENDQNTDPRSKNNALPMAIKVEFDLQRFGKVTRVFNTVSYLPGVAIKQEEKGDTNSSDNQANDNPDDQANDSNNNVDSGDDVNRDESEG